MHSVVNAFLTSRFVQRGIRIIYSARSSHSVIENVSLPKMCVSILPALEDNYMYLISDEVTKFAAVVDPVVPDLILKEVKKQGLCLQSILTTHHHWDHAGGNEALIKALGSIDVYGGDQRVKGITKIVKDGDTLEIGNLKVKCLFTPCHTSSHICYLISAGSESAVLFSGDTLFVAGCGRFFEGTPDQMYKALCEILAGLPDDTKVFCGHEYTISNLKFAHHVEPTNQDIVSKLKWAEEKRKAHQPTVPSTIGEERKTNPFMRLGDPSLMKHADNTHKKSAIAMMGALRNEKDNFKG